jgi:hypothetical protein
MTEQGTPGGLTLENAVLNLKKLVKLSVVRVRAADDGEELFALVEEGSVEKNKLPQMRPGPLTAVEVRRLGEAALLRNILLNLEADAKAANQMMRSAVEKAEHIRDFYGREYQAYAAASAPAVLSAGGDAMMVKYDLVKQTDSAQRHTSEFHAFVMMRRIELDMLLGLKSSEAAEPPAVEEEDLSNPER